MTICRVHRKERDFSTLANEAANNTNLSFRARGMLWHLLTKPDGWEVRMKAIESNSRFDGRDAVRTAFKQLEECGYAIRTRQRDEATGRISWATNIFETLADRNEWAASQGLEPIDGFPSVDQGRVSVARRPVARKGVDIVNTNKEKTELVNGQTKQKTFSEEFEQYFWPDAVRKVGKQYALSAFCKARVSIELETILDGWQTACEVWRTMKHEGRGVYIPNPATWLNQARWNDPPDQIDKGKAFSRPVSGQYVFKGPWGEGRTVLLDQFEAKLMQEAKSFGHNSPSSYAFKVIDSISKGAPIGKWIELMGEPDTGEMTKEKARSAISTELNRLGGNGIVPYAFRGEGNAQVVSDLALDDALKYLDWLKEQPTPGQEASYAA